MNNCIILVLGASGDLAKKKLIPALYTLVHKGILSSFALIGAAYDDTTIQKICEQARPYIKNLDEESFARLVENSYYQRVDFLKQDDFSVLADVVDKVEKQHSLSGNRIVYCATAADFFCPITRALADVGIARRGAGGDVWHRLVYEKPFGHDLKSAQAINECIAQYFDEQQIYRIDHYLTKEIVGNIALIRFTNCIFEPLWNNRYIDHVEIVLSENFGIEHRGAYYDAYGALKDVVQNHMLELMALIGMESPQQLTGDGIRTQRARVLEKITVDDGILGQYEGYKQERAVKADSTTETFAVLKCSINNERWAGVPFYLKTGKYLAGKETAIHIKFKQVACLLTGHCPNDSNYLTIQIAPDSSFFLNLNAKKPGLSNEVMPVKMEFCHSCLFAGEVPEAYEVLLEEIMRGETAVSVRFDEIESSWNIIDAVKNLHLPVYTYTKGSTGPNQVEDFCKKYDFRWRS